MLSPLQALLGGCFMIETLERALTLMRESLALLDEGCAPHDIGAHLDLAICRLEEALNTRAVQPVQPSEDITTGKGRLPLR